MGRDHKDNIPDNISINPIVDHEEFLQQEQCALSASLTKLIMSINYNAGINGGFYC